MAKNLSSGDIQAKLNTVLAGQTFHLDQDMQTNDVFCENCGILTPLEAPAPIVAAKSDPKVKTVKRHYLSMEGLLKRDKAELVPPNSAKAHIIAQ